MGAKVPAGDSHVSLEGVKYYPNMMTAIMLNPLLDQLTIAVGFGYKDEEVEGIRFYSPTEARAFATELMRLAQLIDSGAYSVV